MRALAFIATATLAAGGAAAQSQPGQVPQHDDYVASALRSKKMAHCVLGRAPGSSRAFVLAANAEAAERVLSPIKQAMGGCMSSRDASVTLGAFELRGDLAEALITDDAGAGLERAKTLAPLAPVRLAMTGQNQNDAVVACAVAADPADAVAMIEAPAETPGEMAAFRKLAPGLQACVPERYALHLKPYLVRRAVAIALYRLVAPVAAAQG